MTPREDDLEAIAAQERELHFMRSDEDVAWNLGSRLREIAVQYRSINKKR